MGIKSGVSWTDRSHGFWYGCNKVSEGCKFCYAEREMTSYGKNFHAVQRSKSFDAPLKWPHDPALVFVNPWSDFFHPAADEWREDAYHIMRLTPWLTYQIPTKRPTFMYGRMPNPPIPNIWWGVTVESQDYIDRIAIMARNVYEHAVGSSRVMFVSVEPMLGAVDLSDALNGWPVQISGKSYVTHDMALDAGDPSLEGQIYTDDEWEQTLPPVNWVIAGAESGSKHRETDIAWVRDLRDQCARAGTAFFCKQLWIDGKLVKMPDIDGQVWGKFPEANNGQ